MCKNCGCGQPQPGIDVAHLSHLAAHATDEEHARLHRLGIAHDHHHHEHDEHPAATSPEEHSDIGA